MASGACPALLWTIIALGDNLNTCGGALRHLEQQHRNISASVTMDPVPTFTAFPTGGTNGSDEILPQIARVAEVLLNPSPLGFAIALLVVISVPIFIHNYLASSSSVTSLPSILVVGPLASGKTSLQTLVSSINTVK